MTHPRFFISGVLQAAMSARVASVWLPLLALGVLQQTFLPSFCGVCLLAITAQHTHHIVPQLTSLRACRLCWSHADPCLKPPVFHLVGDQRPYAAE